MRALLTVVTALTAGQSVVVYADHELRKSIFESLGPTAWGMYILLPIPFIALGVIGYFVYRAWRASDSTPPSRDGN
ncbi:MAG: hypothetical protein ACK4HB_07090 [Candidatus Bipolaricaulia bacterium]